MKLIDKLNKTYPKLKEGLPSNFDECVIGVDAEELRLVYDIDLVAYVLTLEGVIVNDINKPVTHKEAKNYVYWNMSVPDRYVIVNLSNKEA